MVDLDAAFGRGPRNRQHLGRIVAAVAPVRVEASGGVRTAADLDALLELGVAPVVIGTAALEDPEWVCPRPAPATARRSPSASTPAAAPSQSVASWLENRDPGSLLEEVKSFARQRPGTFLLVAAGAGLLAGRLGRSLQAGAPDRQQAASKPARL